MAKLMQKTRKLCRGEKQEAESMNNRRERAVPYVFACFLFSLPALYFLFRLPDWWDYLQGLLSSWF